MTVFWKVVAAVLLAVILGLAIGKTEKDLAALLTIAVSCMACMIVMSYLEPVLDFLHELEAMGNFAEGILGILLKSVGIALVVELAGMICKDAGNGSLAKTLQILGSSLILYLSVPVFRSLLTLIRDILGEL